MCEQNASYLAKHSELGSKSLNKIFVKIIQKALKTDYSKEIFKFLGGSMPPDPLKPFLFLNQLQTSSAQKNELEKCVKIMTPHFL